MADEKKIIVDDDWKAEAQREKETLAKEATDPTQQKDLPASNFSELINMLAMQALAGLGMMAGPAGERIPPNPELAKHFIDILQMLEDKTKGNLDDEETKLLDQVLYDIRMRYVQLSSGGMPPAAPAQ